MSEHRLDQKMCHHGRLTRTRCHADGCLAHSISMHSPATQGILIACVSNQRSGRPCLPLHITASQQTGGVIQAIYEFSAAQAVSRFTDWPEVLDVIFRVWAVSQS